MIYVTIFVLSVVLFLYLLLPLQWESRGTMQSRGIVMYKRCSHRYLTPRLPPLITGQRLELVR